LRHTCDISLLQEKPHSVEVSGRRVCFQER
jgi:hypothetical protein